MVRGFQGCIKLVSVLSRIPEKLLTVRQMTTRLISIESQPKKIVVVVVIGVVVVHAVVVVIPVVDPRNITLKFG